MNISLLISVLLFFNLTSQDSVKVKNKKLENNISGIDTTGIIDSTNAGKSELKIEPAKKSINMTKSPLKYPIVNNQAFNIGEKLTFKIRYGFVRAGTATMEVVGEGRVKKRPVYHIRTTAESAAGFSWIYNVDDVIESYIDKQGLFSWKFNKKLHEGSYKADLFVDYFPEDSLADVSFTRYKRRNRVIKKNYQVKTAPFSFDILAAFYYIRTQDLKVGRSVRITNHDNKRVYDLDIVVHRRDTLEVEFGTFRCLVVEPLLKGEGIFKQEGRLQVWLTDDKFKIPVQMTSAVVVGHITTELEKIEGFEKEIPALVARNE